MTAKHWMIVRRSPKIPGGYRVVKAGLTEAQARARAPLYKRPHQAMSYGELVELRTAAQAAHTPPPHQKQLTP